MALTSSSSSSSIDSSSSSSSSSSSQDIFTRDVRMALVEQIHGDIIPFTFTAEKGPTDNLGKSSEIGFTIETSNSPIINYGNVIDTSENKETL